jgi:hypothetical protein
MTSVESKTGGGAAVKESIKTDGGGAVKASILDEEIEKEHWLLNALDRFKDAQPPKPGDKVVLATGCGIIASLLCFGLVAIYAVLALWTNSMRSDVIATSAVNVR